MTRRPNMLGRMTLAAAILMAAPALALAGAAEPDYGDFRGPAPKSGHGTDGDSYRRNTYGEVGTGAVLPGSLAGSTVTTIEGIINSGSYGVPAPGSGIDVLHQDEMKRLRQYRADKKEKQKKAKGEKGKSHGHDSATTETAKAKSWVPEVKIAPTELGSPVNTPELRAEIAPRRSVVRDHAVPAHPNTPGQGGARRDRSTPSTSAGPRLPAFPDKPGEEVAVPKANVAGVAWGRPVSTK